VDLREDSLDRPARALRPCVLLIAVAVAPVVSLTGSTGPRPDGLPRLGRPQKEA
jgi:hypothetical protein